MKHLHFDLINDNILPILPAKSLVRFTSACKLWHYLIKSLEFIAIHLNVNQSDTRPHKILILGESLSYVISDQVLNQHVKLDFIPYMSLYGANPMRYCKGLLFITTQHGGDIQYLLWNPSINKSKTLGYNIHSPHYEECDIVMLHHEIFGLGFHEPSRDHIVVRICYVIDDTSGGIGNVPTEVDVYSLCTDSWHKVDSSPGRLIGSFGSVLINGSIHWIATTRFTRLGWSPRDDHFESILLFDLGHECFKEMALPEDPLFTFQNIVDLYEFKGSLAVVIYRSKYYLRMTILWVMTHYGVTESWTKKVIITSEDYPFSCRSPMGLLGIGILVYRGNQNGTRVVLFDVDSCQERNIEGLLECTAVVDMIDSLVLLQG